MFIHYCNYKYRILNVSPRLIFGGKLIFRSVFELAYGGLYLGGLYSGFTVCSIKYYKASTINLTENHLIIDSITDKTNNILLVTGVFSQVFNKTLCAILLYSTEGLINCIHIASYKHQVYKTITDNTPKLSLFK